MATYDYRDLQALIGDEALGTTNYYRDPTHITETIAEINSGKKDNISIQLATWIRQKMFGIDTREALARFIEWISVLTNKSIDTADIAKQIAAKNSEDFILLSDQEALFEQLFNNKYDLQIAGNTDLDEVIDSRMDIDGSNHTTLNNRLQSDLTATLDTLGYGAVGGEEVADFAKTSLNNYISTIDQSKFNLSIITDTHWDDVEEATTYPSGHVSVNHYNNFLALNAVSDVQVVNGDNYDSRHVDLEGSKRSYKSLVSKLLDRDNTSDIFINFGNHDDGSDRFPLSYKYKNDDFFTEAELKEIARTSERVNGETRNLGDSLYWYKDYPDKQVRVIGLWSQDMPEGLVDASGYAKYRRIHTHAFRQEQLDWLITKALGTVPVGYHTIITNHVPLYYGWTVSDNQPINHDVVKGILKAFMAGGVYMQNSSITDFEVNVTADFTAQGARPLVGWFSGHNHIGARYNEEGINIVILDYSAGNDALVLGTELEDALSMVEVDVATRTVNIKCWGRAQSISYTY